MNLKEDIMEIIMLKKYKKKENYHLRTQSHKFQEENRELQLENKGLYDKLLDSIASTSQRRKIKKVT